MHAYMHMSTPYICAVAIKQHVQCSGFMCWCPFQLSRDNVQKFLQLKFCDIVTIVAKVSTNPSMEQKGLNLSAGVK